MSEFLLFVIGWVFVMAAIWWPYFIETTPETAAAVSTIVALFGAVLVIQ